MNCALFWSGGKDSLLALDRARRNGLRVTHLVNIFHDGFGRVRFHGVRRQYIQSQADALGLTLIQKAASPETFEEALLAAFEDCRALGIGGVVFGNIHLADIREWYESRTRPAGFEPFEPRCGDSPA